MSSGVKQHLFDLKKYRGAAGSGWDFFVAQKISEIEKITYDSPSRIYLVAFSGRGEERLDESVENIKSFAKFLRCEIDVIVFSSDAAELRLKTLSAVYSRLIQSEKNFLPLAVVANLDALLESKTISLRDFRKHSALLRRGEKFPQPLGAFFEKRGYVRAAYVEARGEYSLRGQVVDLWNPSEDLPTRVVLNGDIIEEIKFFDPSTQLSVLDAPDGSSGRDIVLLCPASPDGSSRDSFFESWFGGKKNPLFLRGVFVNLLSSGELPEGFQRGIPSGCPIFVHDPLLAHLCDQDSDLGYEPLAFYGGDISLLERDIRQREQGIKKKIFFYSSDGELKRFIAASPAGIAFEESFKAHVSEGFFNHKNGLFLLPARQFFLKSALPSFFKVKVPSQRLESLWEIKEGDYVVHEKYGIGVYRGISLMDDPPQEFIVVEYKHNDKIYVPVWDFSRLKKYIGVLEGAKPPLSDLDAPGLWERARRRAAQSAEIFAKELLKLYASRELSRAPVMGETTVWEEELAESFPFAETPDQASAIKETLSDLERPRPAERLILGDVGFGKTEVAIRAAFKAAVNSYQTAIIVPTTILAMQHYSRFTERLSPFPAVKVVALHRFLSPSEKKKTIEEISSGAADIVIGTHRLLSSDVNFKNLGLLIIDEEHRFGVRHKEKLRRAAKNIHTIYMSATPIPRTLASALQGLKDISLIETPPVGRKPIETFVMPFSADKVRMAILRELSRGGQIFYVKNFISGLPRVLAEVSRFAKDVRWGMIHGRMKTNEIENTLYEFYRGKLNGVVSTTIIESGLDIPQVNTMIIEDAQDFGLAQLYQLRGRVGRGDTSAYCYLFYDPKKLTEDAVKRIEALKIFSCSLGQGFQLARRDLEIRGAGAAFGYRQHGFLASVGFEYYSALISRAVKNLKTKLGAPSDSAMTFKEEPIISIPHTSAYIPPDYVADDTVRISFYRKFLNVSSPEDIEEVKNALMDRFGKPLPEPVIKLSAVASLRLMMKDKGISSICSNEDGSYTIEFSDDSPVYFNGENLTRLATLLGGNLSFASPSGRALNIKKIPPELAKIGDLPSALTSLLEKILEFATIKNQQFSTEQQNFFKEKI